MLARSLARPFAAARRNDIRMTRRVWGVPSSCPSEVASNFEGVLKKRAEPHRYVTGRAEGQLNLQPARPSELGPRPRPLPCLAFKSLACHSKTIDGGEITLNAQWLTKSSASSGHGYRMEAAL